MVEDTFWGEAIIAPGKTYELTCAIGKTGTADAEFSAEIVNDIDQATENINTEFEMKTYWQNVRILQQNLFLIINSMTEPAGGIL